MRAYFMSLYNIFESPFWLPNLDNPLRLAVTSKRRFMYQNALKSFNIKLLFKEGLKVCFEVLIKFFFSGKNNLFILYLGRNGSTGSSIKSNWHTVKWWIIVTFKL